MLKSLMICSNASNKLHLNESETTHTNKYILEGIFAHLNTKNRNERIYTKEEYLKHLQYLRNDIKSGEPLLGELDHPDDRFEVKLKEASHRVIDLWYDPNTNCIMGKIELLNTPNGKLAQSMVDQGIPLHISSRAAGSVNPDHTVSIQQIYTYDLVCKPGFADAVLHRVDESAGSKNYSNETKSFLEKSLKLESMNAAPQYGLLNENVSVSEIKAPVVLRNEAKALINNKIEITEDMSKPLLENNNPDATTGKPLNVSGNSGAAALGIPVADMGGTNEDDTSDSSTADASTDSVSETDENKKCPKCGNEPCTCEKTNECGENKEDNEKKEPLNSDDSSDASTGDDVSEDKDEDSKDKKEDKKSDDDKKDDDKETSDDDKDDNSSDEKGSGVEILNVEAEFENDDKKDDDKDSDSDDDMIKDVEPYDEDSKKDDDKDSDDKDETSEAKDEDKPCDDDDKCAKEAEKLNDATIKDIDKHKDSIFKKLDDLKATIEKKNKTKEEAKCESIIMAQYPISMMMNENNFAGFVALSESQKNKVVSYLQDNNFVDAKSINENWKNGVDYTPTTPTWLKYAPENYKSLYESASEQVKSNIKNMAKYVLFESQNDINTFWENSGLLESNERKLLNESFVNTLPKVAVTPQETELPYGKSFIENIASMAAEYNEGRYY